MYCSGVIDYENITDSYGFSLNTDVGSKVVVSPILTKDVHKELSTTTLRLHALVVAMKEYKIVP